MTDAIRRNDGSTLRPELQRLRHLLLLAGGDRLQLDWFVNEEISSEEAALLFLFGSFLTSRGSKLVRGAPSECHENAARLADHLLNRRFTGFALSKDGCWRVHSWVMTPDGIVETTERRTLYFGIHYPDVGATATAARQLEAVAR